MEYSSRIIRLRQTCSGVYYIDWIPNAAYIVNGTANMNVELKFENPSQPGSLLVWI